MKTAVERKIIDSRITLKEINANRWNHILGEHKTTEFKCIPYRGVGVIFTNQKPRAIEVIYSEIIQDKEYIKSGLFEVSG